MPYQGYTEAEDIVEFVDEKYGLNSSKIVDRPSTGEELELFSGSDAVDTVYVVGEGAFSHHHADLGGFGRMLERLGLGAESKVEAPQYFDGSEVFFDDYVDVLDEVDGVVIEDISEVSKSSMEREAERRAEIAAESLDEGFAVFGVDAGTPLQIGCAPYGEEDIKDLDGVIVGRGVSRHFNEVDLVRTVDGHRYVVGSNQS